MKKALGRRITFDEESTSSRELPETKSTTPGRSANVRASGLGSVISKWSHGKKRSPTGQRRIVINVGGTKFETRIGTLWKIPGTRLYALANALERDEAWDDERQEFFFDRHAGAFNVILEYHRTEELHVDPTLCGNVLKNEFGFWMLEEQEIEPCCWADYSKYTEHKATLLELDDHFAFAEQNVWTNAQTRWQRLASRTWNFLEIPTSSRAAKVYALVSMAFVVLSILLYVLGTHKMFQTHASSKLPMLTIFPDDQRTPTGNQAYQCCCEEQPHPYDNISHRFYRFRQDKGVIYHISFFYLEIICFTFFLLEFISRLAVCPSKKHFVRQLLNIIDLVCLLPPVVGFVHYSMSTHSPSGMDPTIVRIFKGFMMLRVVRVLRIFKLMKHYSAFKILAYTIKVSAKELLLMVMFLMSGVLLFGSVIYYAENENFPNIPIAIWWALVTMTTVGYGDKYPVSVWGYAVGCFAVLCGVMVIAFTVPIVVNNFSLYYQHAQTRIKLPGKRKRKRDLKKKLKQVMSQAARRGLNKALTIGRLNAMVKNIRHDNAAASQSRAESAEQVVEVPDETTGMSTGSSSTTCTTCTTCTTLALEEQPEMLPGTPDYGYDRRGRDDDDAWK